MYEMIRLYNAICWEKGGRHSRQQCSEALVRIFLWGTLGNTDSRPHISFLTFHRGNRDLNL